MSLDGIDDAATAAFDPRLALLRNEVRDRKHALLRPVDAATLIIVDGEGAEPKVLMGRRHPNHKFMPNKFVFPGGRVDPEDRRMAIAGVFDVTVEEQLLRRVVRPSRQRARALALAAIRETFEETGILLGSREFGAPEVSIEGPWAEFGVHGVFPTLEGIRLLARAITPPRRPRRFDTRFFVADKSMIAHQKEGMVGPHSELLDLAWVTLAETEAMELPVITRVVLQDLAEAMRDGFGPSRPVPFYFERHRVFQRETL